MKKVFALYIFILFAQSLLAQSATTDTLPKFSLRDLGDNRIVIGWINNFENVRQINIQRSHDSLKNFKTILAVADPAIPENGYLDTKAANPRMFYRIYIQLDKGVFFFSESKRPVVDTSTVTKARFEKQQGNKTFNMPKFMDSVNNKPNITNDNKTKVEKWIPSKYVFTNSNGFIKVVLPDAEVSKYSIKVFNSSDELMFELKNMPSQNFHLDKANFFSSGWFTFELYEEGKLKETNKFFLPKEF